MDLDRIADVLGGRVVSNAFGRGLVIERRYESDRLHGDRRVAACDLRDAEGLRVLDPLLPPPDGCGSRTLFVDLETTGLSGGAGTVAFLVGVGWFDLGAFQMRQFLLTSFASERAMLCAVAECFDAATLLVTYNGKTFDVPVMETRWLFHRMRMPLESIRHFDMLHPARRLWRTREGASTDGEGDCRLATLERVLCGVTRVGDVPGMDIPGRYFQFLRTGDARPLEPVMEHNRLDLVSLAAVTAHAVALVEEGAARCRDAAEALALGRVYERAGSGARARACYEQAAADPSATVEVTAEALYRLGLRLRRERRFADAALAWRRILELKQGRPRRQRLRQGDGGQGGTLLAALRQFAVEALAIHHEHREKDYEGAKELTLLLLEDDDRAVHAQGRHRLERLEKKIARKNDSHLFA
jgi:tetratricopeptide (TPR) repeat protein